MNKHFTGSRKFTNRCNFFTRINRSQLSRLGNGDRARLVRMQLGLARDDCVRLIDVDLPFGPANHEQLGAFREKFWRAAFVGLDVCMFMTNDAVKGLAKLSEGERIRGRTAKNKVNLAIGLEDFADTFADTRSPSVISVRCYLIGIRFLQS